MVDTEKINTRRLEREKMKNIMERKRKMTSPKSPISLIPHNIIINSNINEEEEKEEGGLLGWQIATQEPTKAVYAMKNKG